MPLEQKNHSLTLGKAMNETILKLKAHGIKSPVAEAEILLQHITGKQRFDLYLNKGESISNKDYEKLQVLLGKRLDDDPLQYTTGEAFFTDLKLEVSPAVLVPRPETEQLVELVTENIRQIKTSKKLRIVDVGTGSGAIIISLAKAFPRRKIEFIATDISADALNVARKNALSNNLTNIRFCNCSLIDKVEGKIDMIVANLPYIPTASMAELPADVRKEPHAALDGGAYGYEIIERLIIDSTGKLQNGSLLFLEIGIGQDKQISQLMLKNGFNNISVLEDLTGTKRFLMGEYFV